MIYIVLLVIIVFVSWLFTVGLFDLLSRGVNYLVAALLYVNMLVTSFLIIFRLYEALFPSSVFVKQLACG